jgi:hypothetical protein
MDIEKLLSQHPVPVEILEKLPEQVKISLSKMPACKQREFSEIYAGQSKSLAVAYLLLLFIFPFHYAYQDRWGLQVAFWLTAGGFLIWWAMDFFRLPGMVRRYNRQVGVRVLKMVEERF